MNISKKKEKISLGFISRNSRALWQWWTSLIEFKRFLNEYWSSFLIGSRLRPIRVLVAVTKSWRPTWKGCEGATIWWSKSTWRWMSRPSRNRRPSASSRRRRRPSPIPPFPTTFPFRFSRRPSTASASSDASTDTIASFRNTSAPIRYSGQCDPVTASADARTSWPPFTSSHSSPIPVVYPPPFTYLVFVFHISVAGIVPRRILIEFIAILHHNGVFFTTLQLNTFRDIESTYTRIEMFISRRFIHNLFWLSLVSIVVVNAGEENGTNSESMTVRRRHSWCCSATPDSGGKRYATQSTQTREDSLLTDIRKKTLTQRQIITN